MKMKTLVVLISARASFSRIRSVLPELHESSIFEVKIVLMASAAIKKYGRVEEFLEAQGFHVDWKIESQLDAENETSMAKTTGVSIIGLADYLANLRPDGLLVIADRHETIAASICGAFLGIKTIHVQGGERTGNIDDKVRFANSFLSDFHLVSTSESKLKLERCGILSSTIFITGCPSLDFIDSALLTEISSDYFSGVGRQLSEVIEGEFLIVIQHRETTSKLSPGDQVIPTLDVIEHLDIPTIWVWPNSDYGGEEIIREIRKRREKGLLNHVHFEKSFEPEYFINLLNRASCVIGNSSVGIRECSYLGIPAVDIGTRQKSRESGENVISVDFDFAEILKGITLQRGKRYRRNTLYGDGSAARRIRRFCEENL